MNLHPFMPHNTQAERDDTASRFRWSYAIMYNDCPKCGAQAGYYCHSPKGRIKLTGGPHRQRNAGVPKQVGRIPSAIQAIKGAP
jgi:hypothetical protein